MKTDGENEPVRLLFYDPVMLMCCVAIVIQYCNRTMMLTMRAPIRKDLNWDEETASSFEAVYFYGYLFSSVIAGRLSDLYGGGTFLVIAVACWSCLTVCTPFATKGPMGALQTTRVLLGLFEGICFPAVHSLLQQNFEKKTRTIQVGLMGMSGGIGVAMSLCCFQDQKNWSMGFYVLGAMGLLWTAVWTFTIPQRLKDTMTPEGGKTPFAPLEAIRFTGRQQLAVFVGYCYNFFAFGYVGYLLLAWMPHELHRRYGTEISGPHTATIVPCMSGALASFLSGYLADIVLEEWPRQKVRCLIQCTGMLGLTIGLSTYKYLSHTEALGIVTYSFVVFCLLSTVAGSLTYPHDVTCHDAGFWFGFGNLFNTLGGLLSVQSTGFLGSHKKYDVPFDVGAMVTAMAGLFWLAIVYKFGKVIISYSTLSLRQQILASMEEASQASRGGSEGGDHRSQSPKGSSARSRSPSTPPRPVADRDSQKEKRPRDSRKKKRSIKKEEEKSGVQEEQNLDV